MSFTIGYALTVKHVSLSVYSFGDDVARGS